MPETKWILSKKDYKLFQKQFLTWCNVFGLLDWEIHFRFDDAEDYRACIQRNTEDRICIVSLSTAWDSEVTEGNLDIVAFHESLELLLSGLVDCVYQRAMTERQVNAETHAVIRTLENVVYGRIK